jgi:DNA-binding CsgD family transcriptional regulator
MDAGSTPLQIWESAIECLPQFGLSKVIFMDLSQRDTPLILTNACDAWADRYRHAVLAGLDPFARNCLTGTTTHTTGIGHFEDHEHLTQMELDQIAQGSASLGVRTGMSVTIRPDAHGSGVGLNLMTDYNRADFSQLRAEYEGTWRAWCQLLYAGLNAQSAKNQPLPLTRKQLDCLAYFSDGLRTSEVAYKMGLSESTVELHVRNARLSLNARTRDQAVAIAVRAKFI